MRPTITTNEARFIAELLKTELERLRDLTAQEQTLKGEIILLKMNAAKYKDTYIIAHHTKACFGQYYLQRSADY